MKPLEQHLQEKGFGSEIDQRIAMVIKAAHEFYNAPQQTYDEPEQKKLPMRWEDLKPEQKNGWYINGDGGISFDRAGIYSGHGNWPTEEEAQAAKAFIKLLRFRNEWGGKHAQYFEGFFAVYSGNCYSYVFAFKDEATRDLFQSTFADLIKQAAPLL